ncbi:hypothetical protein HOY80DRAFT_998071 [Tuber brumale]|nr:hypothetical protein HOY80DRAFT_998071 [Tuber brumale]
MPAAQRAIKLVERLRELREYENTAHKGTELSVYKDGQTKSDRLSPSSIWGLSELQKQTATPAKEWQILKQSSFSLRKGIPITANCVLFAQIIREIPELLPVRLLCGYGAIEDLDASVVFAETNQIRILSYNAEQAYIPESLAQPRYATSAKDAVIMRIGPSNQMLNAMITTAKLGVQLSLHEGFKVGASEALHHEHSYLMEVEGTVAVANLLPHLCTNNHYTRAGRCAKGSVSDNVGIVSNAAYQLYLAAELVGGHVRTPSVMDPRDGEGRSRSASEAR